MKRDKYLAFGFGVVFLLIILAVALLIREPSPFQILVFRTALALSAAGIGAVIPGIINLDIGWVRAGGALALFVVVYYVNPPQLISDSKAAALESEAESALDRGNFPLARQWFERAVTQDPDSWRPHFGLARTAFRSGEYEEALKEYSLMAEKRKGQGILDAQEIATIDYQKALCLDGMNKYDDELELLDKIKTEADPKSWEYASAIFDRGAVSLMLALKDWPTINDSKMKDAESALSDFAGVPGQPTEWFHYHQLCVDAARSTTSEDQGVLVQTKFNKLIEEFKKLPDSKRAEQTRLLKSAFGTNYQRSPGFPAPCPPLVQAGAKAQPKFVDLL